MTIVVMILKKKNESEESRWLNILNFTMMQDISVLM